MTLKILAGIRNRPDSWDVSVIQYIKPPWRVTRTQMASDRNSLLHLMFEDIIIDLQYKLPINSLLGYLRPSYQRSSCILRL